MPDNEYLVSYGRSGDFGRFRSASEVSYRRGDRVVVRSPQGLEAGTVLCPFTPGHSRFLSRTAAGKVMRLFGAEDQRTEVQLLERGQRAFEEGRRLTHELGLPMEILDVEVLMDGRQAIVHLVSRGEGEQALASALAGVCNLAITLRNQVIPALPDDGHGCDRPDCGKTAGGGGCTSCSSGGGCSSCGKSTHKDDVAAYLAGLRMQMEATSARTALL